MSTESHSFISNPAFWEAVREGRIRDALAAPVQNAPRGAALFGPVDPYERPEDAAVAGLTVFDFLYDWVRIDPLVVEGIDFSRADHIHGLLSLAKAAPAFLAGPADSVAGRLAGMDGYVAERLVAHHLVVQHHTVTFPATSNNAGWDLMVDGHPYQVKCLQTAAGVHEHLSRYACPVFVNADLAKEFQGNPRVIVDPLLHHDAVHNMTVHTLHHAQNLGDFEVPWISLSVTGASVIHRMITGSTDAMGAAVIFATDSTGRYAGGTLGAVMLAALMGWTLGPAGFVVGKGLGSIAGSIGGRKVSRILRGELGTRGEQEEVRMASVQLARDAIDVIPGKLVVMQEQADRIGAALEGGPPSRRPVEERMTRRLQEEITDVGHLRQDLIRFSSTKTGEMTADKAFRRAHDLISRCGVHFSMVREASDRLAEAVESLLGKRERLGA